MPLNKPFFSILIPSYNRPAELERCIRTILKSPFTNFEIIVSDDNSPLSIEIEQVMSLFLGNPKVTFYPQPTNLREPANKNFLVCKAIGDFNIVIGDDDFLAPEALSVIYDFVKEEPHYDIYGFGYIIVDEHNFPISIHTALKPVVLSTEKNVKYLFEFGVSPMSVMHPATFCCRAGVELTLPYREDVGIGEDLCFLLQAAARGYSLVVIPAPLLNWRKVQDVSSVDQGNQSAEHLSSFKAKYLTYKVLNQEGIPNQLLKNYISSSLFRFKFLYVEVLRDPLASDFTALDLGIDSDTASELLQYKRSLFFRFRVRCWRLFSFFDLCQVLTVPLAFKWVVKSVVFRIISSR